MTFAEIVERARSRIISNLREAIADRSSRSKVYVEPALRMKDGALAFAPDGLKLPLRWDFYSALEPEEKNADSLTLKFVEPVYATWANRMQIELITVCWDCMVFTLSPPAPDEDWKWLTSWFMKWFDPDDENEADEDGLHRVVHFISDPQCSPSSCRFFVDFGSSKVDSMGELLDRIAERGYTKCIIGDERQPQPPLPTLASVTPVAGAPVAPPPGSVGL